MNIINIIGEEIRKFIKENYDSEQGSVLDTYFDRKYPSTGVAKTGLSGEFIGSVPFYYPNQSNRPYNVYKNPTDLNGFDNDCRGILLNNTDYYIVDNKNLMHSQILKYFQEIDIVPYGYVHSYDDDYPREFLCIHRQGNSNVFGISTAYMITRLPDYYYDLINRANKRGRIKFEPYYHKG